jgi:acyl-coenzyme A thioesterase PaaI-like protein
VAERGVIPPHHDPACWGCGDAPGGIHLPQPEVEGLAEYDAWFQFDERHQAGPGLVHGGLVAAALDEACGLLATWYRFPTVTARILVRYRAPVPINTELLVRAWLQDERGRRLHVDAELGDGSDVLAEARAAFLHVPLEHFLATPEGRAAADAWRRRFEG